MVKKKTTKKKVTKRKISKKKTPVRKMVKKECKECNDTCEDIHKKELVFLGLFMAAFGLLTVLADYGILSFQISNTIPVGFLLILIGFIAAIAGVK